MALLNASRLLAAAAVLSLATSALAEEVCPQFMTETTVAGNTLFFTLSPGESSTLWRTDGTAAGTFPLHAGRHEVDKAILASVGGTVFFTHDPGPLELWKTW
jgi:hypothetical protein